MQTTQTTQRAFVSYRRVSTHKQGKTGLGLDVQKEYIDHFVALENGTLIQDFEEVYTGKNLSGCVRLQAAIEYALSHNATLIIAKTDRFRNTEEALQIYNKMNGNIYFCDLPNTDKFMLTLFFALAEREALLVSMRTKMALRKLKERGVKLGNKQGINLDQQRQTAIQNKQEAAKNHPSNRFFWVLIENKFGPQAYKATPTTQDYNEIASLLNKNNINTPTGLPYNTQRARDAFRTLKRLHRPNNTNHV